MSKTERLYRIEGLIRQRGHLSFAEMLQRLEVSRATLKRDLEYLRSRLGAPIVYDVALNGYRFEATPLRGERHELPGLWFDQRELHALLTAHQLLAGLDSDGLLARHLQPLLDRIHALLGHGEGEAAQMLMQRVRIVSAQRRPVPAPCFEKVSAALLGRRRLHLDYLTRGRAERSTREVSPQRLVHYRHTWYLDAWCHRVDALRRFALDAIEQAQLLHTAALELPLATVEAEMDAGYGIYAGGRRRWAELEFDARAAQWASREQWHPQQQGRLLADGRFRLRLPYVDDTELVMEVLRQGEQVRVVSPRTLREAVQRRLHAAVAQYDSAAGRDGGRRD
jgi:predicted DNA-binding transcriptional regulator YafY